MAREMFRKGDDLRGPAELRLALPRDDEATPPTPVPALLADCGVFSRPWTVRPMPEGLTPLLLFDGNCGGEVERCVESFESSCDEVFGGFGEMLAVWYDIACGAASGGFGQLWGSSGRWTNEEARHSWNVDLIDHLMTINPQSQRG